LLSFYEDSFLVLSILGGAQIQAGSWFESFRNYSPYQWGSFKRYAPENVTSRLAAMRYLYGNDVAQDQEQLVNDYYKYLDDKLMRQNNRNVYLARAEAAARYLANQPETFDYTKLKPYYSRPNPKEAAEFQEAADYMYKRRSREDKPETKSKWSKLYELRTTLKPPVEAMEAEMLKPGSYYQYQHPDQYILNY
jgi:hypothetical protein